MPVVCDQCGTGNRESAKFCRGCAARLPTFAATGASALEGMKALRTAHPAIPPASPPAGQLPIETRAFWVRFAVLSVVVTTAFVSWYAYVTRKVPLNPAPSPAQVAAVAPAAAVPARPAAAATLPLAPLDVPKLDLPKLAPPEPVRAAEALAPGERLVTPGPAQLETLHAMRPPRSEAQPERMEHPRKVAARPTAADPRPACAHLNFIAASRCEANQCAKPQYTRHPHCSAVREQTRRDVARRNPLQLGY